MKVTDFNLTRAIYDASPKNKGGVFDAPLGVLRNFGYTPNTIDDAGKDKIFAMYAQSAFDDIDAFNPDRPLPRLLYTDLNSNLQEIFRDSIILQINQLLKNGLMETTGTSTASTGSFTSSVTPNTKIVSPDQLSQDVEDELDKARYKEWQVVKNKDGSYTIYLDEQNLIIPKTKNGIALSAITIKGLDAADLTILGEKYVIQLIDNTIARSRAFRGTWNAASTAQVALIDNEFSTNGLVLTDGTVLTPANTVKGDTILISVTSDNNWSPEEVVYDSVNWVTITNNNSTNEDISEIEQQLTKDNIITTTGFKSQRTLNGLGDDDSIATKAVIDAADAIIETKADANTANVLTAFSQIATERSTNNLQQQQINTNTTGRIQWENERTDYVRVDDIEIATPIDLNGRQFVLGAANTYTMSFGPIAKDAYAPGNPAAELPALNLSQLTTGGTTVIKGISTIGANDARVDLEDSFNDSSNKHQNIFINEVQIPVTVKIDSGAAVLTGNLDKEEDNFLAIKWERIEQITGSTGAIDQTARQSASDADQKAVAADNNAETRVRKELVQNVDFSSFADFQGIIKNDELVAITFADGVKITGRVTDAGNPVVISGSWVENQVFKIGEFSITSSWAKTGGKNIDNFALDYIVNTKLKFKAQIDLNNVNYNVFKIKGLLSGLSQKFRISVRSMDTVDQDWLNKNWNNIISADVRPFLKLGLGTENNLWHANTGITDNEPIAANWFSDDDNKEFFGNKDSLTLRASFNHPTHYDDGSYNVGYFEMNKSGSTMNKIWTQKVGDSGRTDGTYIQGDADLVWIFTYIEYYD